MPAKRKTVTKKPAKDSAKSPPAPNDALLIVPAGDAKLGPVQAEFNKLMKRLAGERRKLERHRERLDRDLEVVHRELLPILEEIHRADRDFVFAGAAALGEIKLGKKRRRVFGDILASMSADLLDDPLGLGEADLERLETIHEAHKPAAEAVATEAGDIIREMMQALGLAADLGEVLDGLGPEPDPDEIKRRIAAKLGVRHGSPRGETQRARKPTKKQLEKERLQRELDEAKSRDIKSLYKQLAKVLHPDLEPDPTLRAHKEIWMKRLTAAYSGGDLRDMLEIEMEWLGEESGNLAHASDSKLRGYCLVLKEQIGALGRQICQLDREPQYRPLSRFRNPYSGRFDNPAAVKREMRQILRSRRWNADELSSPAPRPKRAIEALADHAASPQRNPFDH